MRYWLYRECGSTFEDYCNQRWGFNDRHARRLIDSAEVMNNLKSGPIGPLLPATESQARPLTKLEPELQPVVWQKAVETAPNGKVTAAHVEVERRRTFVLELQKAINAVIDGVLRRTQ